MKSSTSPRSKSSISNPYEKTSKSGKYNHEATLVKNKGDRVSLPESMHNNVSSKTIYMSTPSPTQSNSKSNSAAIVTNTSLLNSDRKTLSKQYNMLSPQSPIVSKINFEELGQGNVMDNSASTSTETTLKSSYRSSCSSTTSIKQQYKEPKMELYSIDWTDSDKLRLEAMKYDNIPEDMVLTQENVIRFLVNESKTPMIKSAFSLLIGKVGNTAIKVFMPIPTKRDRLIEEFLVLIFNIKSIMVDTEEHEFK